jgi:hypothetical protein
MSNGSAPETTSAASSEKIVWPGDIGKRKRMMVMHFNKCSLASAAVLFLVSAQLSQAGAQPNKGTNIAATAGNQNQAGPSAYIGRVESRGALTVILVPTDGNQVILYYGKIGSIPLSDVKMSMLDKIGAFPLKRALSDGIFFDGSNYQYNLQRETVSNTPGSVIDGPVQFQDGRRVFNTTMYFFEYKEPK